MTGQAPAPKNRKRATHILFGDDQKYLRNSYAHSLQVDFGCQVQKPAAFEDLATRIAVQLPDGVIMDYNLKRDWELKPLNGDNIQTGYDVIKFYQKLNPIIPVCLYSQQELPDYPSIFVIDKADDYNKVKKVFKRFIMPVNKVRQFFERYQPKKMGESIESKLNKYRILLKIFTPWLDYGFKKARNPYWAVLFDREVKMYGVPPNRHKENRKIFDISVEEKYPTSENLNYLSQNSEYESLVFWAAHNERIIDKQFAAAGPGLEGVPLHLQEYFSICMVPSCIKLYLHGNVEKAIKRVRILSFSSQLEFIRSVFKELTNASRREQFKVQCAEAKLPVVFSVFKGRIDDILKDASGNKTAWVILEKVHSKQALAEPFDYGLLSANDIKYQNSLFEYMVFKQTYTMASSITPDYEMWDEFLAKISKR